MSGGGRVWSGDYFALKAHPTESGLQTG